MKNLIYIEFNEFEDHIYDKDTGLRYRLVLIKNTLAVVVDEGDNSPESESITTRQWKFFYRNEQAASFWTQISINAGIISERIIQEYYKRNE